MRQAKYVTLFALVQLAQLPLMIIGVPLIAVMAALKRYHIDGMEDHWDDSFMWLWDNEQDGIDDMGPMNWATIFYWSALRNPVHNFGLVSWVNGAGKGRPLYYRTVLVKGKHQFYFKAGWMSNGYPCLSIGAGRGY